MKRAKTPTFLLELPLQVDWSQERHLRAHLEVARCLYNALLSEANKRLRRMRNDPEWASARALPRANKQERAQAFAALRKKHHFSEYELHEYAKRARVSWIAEHIDSTMAQTLATRAYQAANRVMTLSLREKLEAIKYTGNCDSGCAHEHNAAVDACIAIIRQHQTETKRRRSKNCRKAFKKWFLTQYREFPPRRNKREEVYWNDAVKIAWLAWQAA